MASSQKKLKIIIHGYLQLLLLTFHLNLSNRNNKIRFNMHFKTQIALTNLIHNHTHHNSHSSISILSITKSQFQKDKV